MTAPPPPPRQVVGRIVLEVELLLPLVRVALSCLTVDSLQLLQAQAVGEAPTLACLASCCSAALYALAFVPKGPLSPGICCWAHVGPQPHKRGLC